MTARTESRHQTSSLSRWLALVALTSIVACLVLALVVGGRSSAAGDLGEALLYIFVIVPWAVVGALLVFRVPGNLIAWLCLAFAGSWALWAPIDAAGLIEVAAPGSFPGIEYWYAFGNSLWVPGIATIAYILILFPDGTVPSPRWRKLIIALSVVSVLLVLTGWFSPGEYTGEIVTWENPLGLAAFEPLEPVALVLVPALALCLIGAGVALAVRYRRSTGIERAQLKWLVAAGAISAVGYAIWLVGALLGMEIPPQLFFLTIPTAIWYSITRHRLYELDSLLSRTISYALVLAVLAGVYAGAVFLLGNILPLESDLAVAMATLGAAALFNPLRRRIQSWVERRFNRSRYDASAVVDRFASELRNSYDPDEIADQWQGVVDETLSPSRLGIWIAR